MPPGGGIDPQQQSMPYVNLQSIGPNGRPSVTYASSNFGFYIRTRELDAIDSSDSGSGDNNE